MKIKFERDLDGDIIGISYNKDFEEKVIPLINPIENNHSPLEALILELFVRISQVENDIQEINDDAWYAAHEI